jgi:hypothetical protein
MKLSKLLILITVVILASCSKGGGSTPSQAGQPEATKEIPTQDPNKGMVTGKIITDKPEDRNGLLIYLGDVIIDSNGNVGGFLDKTRAPNALVNGDDGTFTIRNVPTGEYSLIIYEVVFGGRAYTDPTGNVMIVKVEPGKTVDLGDIEFSGY